MSKKSYYTGLLLVISLVLTSFISLACAEKKQSTAGKAAIVNGVVITEQELKNELNRDQQQRNASKQRGTPQQPSNEKDILDRLISAELLYQEAKKNNINVDEKEFETQLNSIKKQFPSEEKFAEALKTLNLSPEELGEQLKRQMLIKNLIETKVVNKITLPETEIKNYYDTNPDVFKRAELIKASHILIQVPPDSDTTKDVEARKKIESIQVELKNGADFAELAKKYSSCPSSKNGGDLGFFERGQMVEPFEKAAFALKPGKISDIVRTRFGYHLIKVTDYKPAGMEDFNDVKTKIEQFLRRERINKGIQNYIKDLKKNAKIEIFMFKDDNK